MKDEQKEQQLELEESQENKKHVLNAFEEKVDDFKDTAEKAAGFVGDAAKGVGEFAGKQINIAKGILGKVSDDIEAQRKKQRFEKYHPIFVSSLDEGSLEFPEMINLVDNDKRLEIDDFHEAIGYQQTIHKQDVLDIYKKAVEEKYRFFSYGDVTFFY